LNSERNKSKDLANKLYQTQAELNTMRTQGSLTPLVPTRLNFEAHSPAYRKLTTTTISKFQSFHKQVIHSKMFKTLHGNNIYYFIK